MFKLSLEKKFSMWSDGVLFAFNQVEVLNKLTSIIQLCNSRYIYKGI